MKIEINCQQRWFEAQQKACELGDNTLNACIARVISFATCKDWDVENAKKLSDKYQAMFDKAFELQSRILKDDVHGTDILERATTLKWKLYDKQLQAYRDYCDMKSGGTNILHIESDYYKDSFYFYIERKDGTVLMNGGIIFSRDKWQIHT